MTKFAYCDACGVRYRKYEDEDNFCDLCFSRMAAGKDPYELAERDRIEERAGNQLVVDDAS